jgi:hypothetical protein
MMNPATSPGSAQAELPVSRTTRTWLPRRPGLLALAWLAASAWGSVVQTQFNLNALTAADLPLPAPIGLGLRLQTTLHDLLGFGPAYAALVLLAWLPALGLAAALGRRWPGWRSRLFTAAGGLGVVAAITAVNAVAPMPALIDATRSAWGLGVMAAGCALSAGLYARAMSRPGR